MWLDTVVNARRTGRLTLGKETRYPVQEARWAPRPVWTHKYSKVTTGVRISNRPPHSGWLFQARGHRIDISVRIRPTCVYQRKNCTNVTRVGIFLRHQCVARIDFSSRAWPCAHECGHHIHYDLIMFSQHVEVYTLTRAQIARLGQLTFYVVVNTSQNRWARCGNITEISQHLPTHYDSRSTPAEVAGLPEYYTIAPS